MKSFLIVTALTLIPDLFSISAAPIDPIEPGLTTFALGVRAPKVRGYSTILLSPCEGGVLQPTDDVLFASDDSRAVAVSVCTDKFVSYRLSDVSGLSLQEINLVPAPGSDGDIIPMAFNLNGLEGNNTNYCTDPLIYGYQTTWYSPTPNAPTLHLTEGSSYYYRARFASGSSESFLCSKPYPMAIGDCWGVHVANGADAIQAGAPSSPSTPTSDPIRIGSSAAGEGAVRVCSTLTEPNDFLFAWFSLAFAMFVLIVRATYSRRVLR